MRGLAVAALLAVAGACEPQHERAEPAERPPTVSAGEATLPDLPDPSRAGPAPGAAPIATVIRLVNPSADAIELHHGGPVQRDRLAAYVNLRISRTGVEGPALRLEGSEPVCPERRIAAVGLPSRRPPCRAAECVLKLRPGETLEIPFSGWVLAPDDPRATGNDPVGCFLRRAPLPVEHNFEVCGPIDRLGAGTACARARVVLPARGPIVLSFDPNGSVGDAASL